MTLSPSKIKTFSSCSEIYTAKYLDKIPDRGNDGSARGSAVHEVFEILLNKPKYENLVQNIIKTREIPASIMRLIGMYLKSYGFYSEHNLKKCKTFLLTGLDNDFYCEGGELQIAELHFEIGSGYKIQGLIDKHALYTDKDGDLFVVVVDYKSAKSKFTELELKTNLQGFAYLLAVKQKYPKLNLFKSYLKFIMLDFPEDPIQIFRLTGQEQINGFEAYLQYMSDIMLDFSDKNRKDSLAAAKGFPTADEGFTGLLMCGIGVNYENELKKDGKTPKYYCPFRFPLKYYVPIKNNKEEKGFRDIKLVDKFKNKGYTIETRKYSGCPHWNKEDLL
jgi:hypothetical protein